MRRDEGSFAVFGFDSTHDALKAETVLLAETMDVVLIPTPRSLGTLCGFAVRVPSSEREVALQVLRATGIDATGVIEIGDRVAP